MIVDQGELLVSSSDILLARLDFAFVSNTSQELAFVGTECHSTFVKLDQILSLFGGFLV
jgi:hypothetical protein